MLAHSQDLFLGKRSAPNNFMFEESEVFDFYPCGYQNSNFGLDYKGLIVDEINFFDNLNNTEAIGNDIFDDNVSFRIQSELSETRSLSDLEVENSDACKKFDFSNEEKIWHQCPDAFNSSASTYNDSLNDKLKKQCEDVDNLLQKMAAIIVISEPKKAKFIIDCRNENSTAMKKRLAISMNKKLAIANATKINRTSSESDSIQFEKNSCVKQGSLCSNSTAPTKKMKLK